MRNHNQSYISRAIMLTLILGLSLAPGKAEQIVNVSQRVDELISEMPAQTKTQQSWMVQELLELGPSGTSHLLRRLGDVQDNDNQARLLVSALAKYLGKDRQVEAVADVEKRFTEYLVSDRPPRAAQTFVLNQLQFFVTEASIEPLAGLIEDVCFPIVRILTTIGTSDALEAMLKYSDKVPAECNAAILQACVQLKGLCQELAQKYHEHAIPVVADAAHRANLLDPAADNSRGKNLEADRLLDRWEASAKSGDISALKSGLPRLLREADNAAIAVRATVLAKNYLSDKTVSMVSKAIRNMDGQRAAEVIGVFHNSDLSLTPLFKMADDLKLPAQIALASLAAEREDKDGMTLARGLLSKADDGAKMAGLRALAGIQGKTSLPELMSFLKQAKNMTTARAAATTGSQFVTKQNAGILKEVLHQSSEYGQAAIVEMIARRGMKSFFGDIITLASSPSDDVRNAVFAAMPSISSPANYGELIALQSLAKSDLHTKHLTSALVGQYDSSEGHREVLKTAFDDQEQRKMIGAAMAGIGDDDLLDFTHQKMLETGGYPNDAKAALLQWSKPNALQHLNTLINDKDPEVRNAAVARILSLANGLNPTQRLLKVRHLMEQEIALEDRTRALSNLGRIPGITVFNYLRGFLDDPDLRMTAASTFLRVGLNLIDDESGALNLADLKTMQKAVKILGDEVNQDDAAKIYLQAQRTDLASGFRSLFNGKDLSGWQGLVGNPISRSKMSLAERQRAQVVADSIMHTSWFVEDGILRFEGDGFNNLTTEVESFDNFELILDWKIEKDGDSGIYLKGSPQIQIWDPASEGNQVGSGGLFNNQVHAKEPSKVADNPVGAWNTFRIIMIDDRVTVYLNGELVTDHVVLENYWDRENKLFARGPIELQAHTTPLYFRDLYVRPIEGVSTVSAAEQEDGFVALFNGVNLDGWIGNKTDYVVEDGEIRIYPTISGGSGNLFTAKEYDDFTLRFEFKLTPGANNGLGIHAPLTGDAAYEGKELQILDNTAEIYSKLKEYQYHGSAYGVAAAKRGFLKPVGEWNEQEVQVEGNKFKVILNGEVILDADLDAVSKDGTLDGRDHPGLKRTKGYIGFLGHGSEVHFRNLRIKER